MFSMILIGSFQQAAFHPLPWILMPDGGPLDNGRRALPPADTPRDRFNKKQSRTMALDTLRDVLIHELRDLYNAEQQLSKAMPRIVDAAMNPDLREAIADHASETDGQIDRLERICDQLGIDPGGEHCNAMEGLIEEATGIISESGTDDAKDAALIAAAQRIEHYEMAGYGSARSFAERLGYTDIIDSLQETLDEESAADEALTGIATGETLSTGINEEAMVA